MSIDTIWSNVSLLLPLSSDLLDVKGHSVTANGGVALSSAVGTPFGAGSACYFDGVDDYLSLADSADWHFSGNYTIEFWLYVVATEATGSWLVQQSDGLGAYCPVRIDLDSSGRISVYGSVNNSSWLFTSLTTSALSLGQWYHIAVTDDGTTFRVFVGGAVGASRASWSTDIAQPLLIGGGYSAGDREANCYLSNVRITKGSARYTSSFSVPTAPFPRPTISGHVYDASAAPVAKTILVHDRSTQLYLGGANSDPSTGAYTFYPSDFGEVTVTLLDELCDPMPDECVFDLVPALGSYGGGLNADNKGHRLTFNGYARIYSDQYSVIFDASGDYISSVSSHYALGYDDFSIELAFYPTAGGHGGTYARLLQIGVNTTAGSLAMYSTNNYNPMQFDAQFYDTAWHGLWTYNSTTISNSAWHKLQLRRVNGVFTAYIDDVLWGTSSALSYNITGTTLAIGSNTTGGESFKGRIGPVRISRGPRRAAQVIPASRLLTGPTDGGSGENAIIYDRVIPGSP